MSGDKLDFAVELIGLEKSYGRTVVLDSLDLSVPRGIVFGYLGPNGAGKSTTVRTLMGMDQDFRGEARVCGIDVRAEPIEVKRRVGYVPENASLYEVLSVREHLALVGRLFGLAESTVVSRAQALVEAFDLGTRYDSRIGSLSKGMRQKVLFSGALLHRPELLIMDEPLTGLDVASTMMVKELLRQLADGGTTVFYCSHVMDVVERVCDRIAILSGGKIVSDGSFEELQTRSGEAHLESIFAQLTGADSGADRAARVLDALGRD